MSIDPYFSVTGEKTGMYQISGRIVTKKKIGNVEEAVTWGQTTQCFLESNRGMWAGGINTHKCNQGMEAGGVDKPCNVGQAFRVLTGGSYRRPMIELFNQVCI